MSHALLTSLAQYAESGSFPLFTLINENLEDHINSKCKSCKIPLSIAKPVAEHLIKVIANHAKSDRMVRAWSALSFLCDRLCNSNCFNILTELESTEVLSHAARSIAVGGEEAEFCYKFLTMFSRADCNRQILIGETEGLCEAHLASFDKKFHLSDDTLKIAMLNLTTNLLGRSSTTSFVNINKFTACGGLQSTYRAIQSTRLRVQAIQTLRTLSYVEEVLIHSCLVCLSNVCEAMTHAAYASASELALPKKAYEFTVSQLLQLSDTVHYFTTVSDDIRIKDGLFILFVAFFEYTRIKKNELLEPILLYKGKGKSNSESEVKSVPLVVHFARASRDPRLSYWKDTGSERLNMYSVLYPSVMAALEGELRTNGDHLCETAAKKERTTDVCAFPGCNLNFVNCGGGLKQCARCKAVAYCGREHQLAHWKTHKETCAKKTCASASAPVYQY